MAAKFLHSLTDDTADFQRQMGCMTGIFQLFDRQHMLTSRKRMTGYSSRGNPHLNVRNSETESDISQLQSSSLEKYSAKNMPERQKNAAGSSRASLSSSSCSSSFSSIDYARAAQLESASFDRIMYPENPSSVPFVQQSSDIRDFVKDSMYRELQGLKAKITDTSFDRNENSSADVKKYLQILAKFQDGVLYSQFQSEPRELFRSSSYRTKDVSSFSIPQDPPRLSYDGGRAVQGQRQRRGNEPQGPGIVAKLMGLEPIPDSVSSNPSTVGSSAETNLKKQVQLSGSSLNSWKEPNSPNWRRNSDSPATRFPIEPAPWKHSDAARSSRKPASKGGIQHPVTPSVYTDIDRRLEGLEILQSGKDLRALKQILGTMKEGQCSNFFSGDDSERKGLSCGRAVYNRKPVSEEVMPPSARRKEIPLQINESPIVVMKPAKHAEKDDIRILLHRSGESAENRRRLSRERASSEHGVHAENMKVGRNTKATEASVKPKDGNAGSAKISGSVRPRTVQKKTELEKRSLSPASPDSTRTRRQPNQPRSESSSPIRRRRTLSSSCTNTESTNLSANDIDDTAQSNETIISSSTRNSQMMSLEAPQRIINVCGLTTKSIEGIFSRFPDKESAVTSSEEESAESGFVPPEYSSPVSVLDSGMLKPDTSPVKYVGKSLKVELDASVDSDSVESIATLDFNKTKLRNIENLVLKLRRLNSSHDESRTDYIALLCDNSDPDHRYISEILLASGFLLRALTDFRFHPSGHPINPELFLVLEQTKACTSSPNGPCSGARMEKNHRKLVFDAVNEILAKKLLCIDPHSEQTLLRSLGFASKSMTSQTLLRDLCSEIDALQMGSRDDKWKSLTRSDIMRIHNSESWVDFRSETSDAVLNIERMIFKDLVNEIVVAGY